MSDTTTAPDVLPAGPVPGAGAVARLSDEAAALVSRLPGPLRRVRLQLGEVEIEVEWAPDPITLPQLPVAAPPATAGQGLGAAAAAGGAWLVPPGGTGAVPGTAEPAPGTAEPAAGGGGPQGPAPGAVVVESPVVGVFHRAPEPDAPPFVEVGDRVERGRQLGIIEAMKLMNPIEADVTGVVVAVRAESGSGVEYGQPLFEIVPDEV